MKVNVFYKTPDALQGIPENNGILSESQESQVLSSLQDLLSNPDVIKGVQNKISQIQDYTQRNLLQATLNRMGRLEDGANQIHAQTHARLEHLLHSIPTTESHQA